MGDSMAQIRNACASQPHTGRHFRSKAANISDIRLRCAFPATGPLVAFPGNSCWRQQNNAIQTGKRMAAAATAPEPVIVANGASKLFLDGAVVAFHQLSLAVRRNEIMCVVGPSGCGKTTLLRCIAGLTDLSSGSLLVHGKAVGARPPDGVAMVFQHFGLLPWKTVFDNAAFGLAMAGVPRAEIKARVMNYLDLVGLTGFEGHYPYQPSA